MTACLGLIEISYTCCYTAWTRVTTYCHSFVFAQCVRVQICLLKQDGSTVRHELYLQIQTCWSVRCSDRRHLHTICAREVKSQGRYHFPLRGRRIFSISAPRVYNVRLLILVFAPFHTQIYLIIPCSAFPHKLQALHFPSHGSADSIHVRKVMFINSINYEFLFC